MRLTELLTNECGGIYTAITNERECIDKLGKYEDIENELGIDFITLFDRKYEEDSFMYVEKDKKHIYFCGDAYYGRYTKEQILSLIKELISAYRELIKVEAKKEELL